MLFSSPIFQIGIGNWKKWILPVTILENCTDSRDVYLWRNWKIDYFDEVSFNISIFSITSMRTGIELFSITHAEADEQ